MQQENARLHNDMKKTRLAEESKPELTARLLKHLLLAFSDSVAGGGQRRKRRRGYVTCVMLRSLSQTRSDQPEIASG